MLRRAKYKTTTSQSINPANVGGRKLRASGVLRKEKNRDNGISQIAICSAYSYTMKEFVLGRWQY